MKELELEKLVFKKKMDDAVNKFNIGTGRIAALRVISQNLVNPFRVEEGRKEFLGEYNSQDIQGYVRLFPDLLEMKAKYGERGFLEVGKRYKK